MRLVGEARYTRTIVAHLLTPYFIITLILDIVFFGEQLPERFFRLRFDDFNSCDLLIVMGTSLKVQPFASLCDG